MLENEHRGIRIAAVEAVVTITKIQLEVGTKATYLAKIQSAIGAFSKKLVAEGATLYRRVGGFLFSFYVAVLRERMLSCCVFWGAAESGYHQYAGAVDSICEGSGVECSGVEVICDALEGSGY